MSQLQSGNLSPGSTAGANDQVWLQALNDGRFSVSALFDQVAGYSNGDPIPRRLAIEVGLRHVPDGDRGLDRLLLESELLSERFDRDREVAELRVVIEREPDVPLLEALLHSLSTRFAFLRQSFGSFGLACRSLPERSALDALKPLGFGVLEVETADHAGNAAVGQSSGELAGVMAGWRVWWRQQEAGQQDRSRHAPEELGKRDTQDEWQLGHRRTRVVASGRQFDRLSLGPGGQSRVAHWEFDNFPDWPAYDAALQAGHLPLAQARIGAA